MDSTLAFGIAFVLYLIILLFVRILKNTKFIFHKKIK